MHTPRILIVDDEEQIRILFSRILSEVGYGVTAVSSGYRALTELRHNSYEAMVVDLSLPDMDGLDLLHRARQESPHVKILVVSGYTIDSMTALIRKLGAHATLDKVRAPGNLLVAVCRLLDGSS